MLRTVNLTFSGTASCRSRCRPSTIIKAHTASVGSIPNVSAYNLTRSRSDSDRSARKTLYRSSLGEIIVADLIEDVLSAFPAPPFDLRATTQRCSLPRLFEREPIALHKIGDTRGKLREV